MAAAAAALVAGAAAATCASDVTNAPDAPVPVSAPPAPVMPVPRRVAVEDDIFAPLEWLAKAQNADGGWGTERAAPSDVISTSLVLLTYLGTGETHQSRRYKATVKNGLKFLRDRQSEAGRIGMPDEHAVAALALAESYGMTQSRWLVDSAQRAIGWMASQSDAGREPEWDSSTLVWTAMALKSADMAGLRVEKAPLEHIATRIAVADAGTSTDTERVAGTSCVLAMAGRVADARAVFARTVSEAAGSSASLSSDPVIAHLGSIAAFQVGEREWVTWKREVALPLIHRRETDAASPDYGSWAPSARGWGASRVRATALSMMVLSAVGFRRRWPRDTDVR